MKKVLIFTMELVISVGLIKFFYKLYIVIVDKIRGSNASPIVL